jgi:hypothetical protein
MVREDHDSGEQLPATSGSRARSWKFLVAVLVLAAVSITVATGFLMPRGGPPDPVEGPPPGTENQARPLLFNAWPKPDVALVLSGQAHGFLQPCGCSHPQYGGLARRYNFVEGILLKERGWPVVAVDLGDVPQRRGPQALLKYTVAMKALQLLRYTAVGTGENEMAMPLIAALGEYALNNPSPRVLAANLVDKDKNFPGMLQSWEITGGQNGVPRIGVIGVVADSVAALSQDADVRFDPVDKVLPGVLRELEAQRPEFLVLLFQGSLEEAKACAAKYKPFQVILCLSREEEPSGKPELVGNTAIIAVGHKGRYVGVVGAYRTGRRDRPFELRYELVSLGPQYETPAGKEADNPIHALLEEYARTVKAGDYLARYPQTNHPVQVQFPGSTYVGSQKCKACHTHAYDVWMKSGHAHAYETLVTKAHRPSLRQFDGECVVCHTVGFGYTGGFTDEPRTPHLKDVGCETCHGPGSLHVKDWENPSLRAAMNPLKAKPGENPRVVANRIDASCQKCHDTDNSVHFNFEKYWPKIEHKNPE